MALTFFGVNAGTVPPGSPVEIGIFVNTQGETVNAVSGDVILPAGVTDISILNSGSLISLWLVPPKVTDGKIHFEGVIPGGITSSQLPVFSVVLTPSAAGDLSVKTEDVHVYKNDGLGTELPVTNGSLTLKVQEGAPVTPEHPADTTPPEAFTPVFLTDNAIAGGHLVIAFAAVDNDSGVDHYEVREAGLVPGSWVTTSSPYVLHAAYWPMSSVEIRAIDRAGNVRTESVSRPVEASAKIFTGGCILGVVIAAALLAALYRRRLWRKQGHSRYRSR